MPSSAMRRGVKFGGLFVATLSFAGTLANFIFQEYVLMAATAVITAYALMLVGDACVDDLRDRRDG